MRLRHLVLLFEAGTGTLGSVLYDDLCDLDICNDANPTDDSQCNSPSEKGTKGHAPMLASVHRQLSAGEGT